MTETTRDAFTTELQRLYSLERALVTDLDVLASDVSIDTLDDFQETECRKQLRTRIERHRDETESHRERLAEVIDTVGIEQSAQRTPERDGWIADKERFNNSILNDKLRPLYYLDATKRLEEIERSLYEPILALAHQLENEDAGIVTPIEQIVEEEQTMLADLDSLADSESVAMLLETSPVDPTDRSSLDRSGGNIETLEDMFVSQLQNIYYIEQGLIDLFEEMALKTSNTELEQTVSDPSQTQVDRLTRVFEAVGPRVTDSQNHTFDGLAESWEDRRPKTAQTTDLFILGTALAAVRITSRYYDELLTLADRIGYSDDAINLLTTNRDDNRSTIQTLEDTSVNIRGIDE